MTQPGNPLTDNMSYTQIIDYYLGQWGMSDLASLVDDLGRQGASSDQINLTLQQTPEWKTRFAGNELRMQQGLAPLDPATYIGLEDSYRQLTNQLPAGFFTKQMSDALIGHDVSPSELASRVQHYNDLYVNGTPEARQAELAYFGYKNPGGVIAAMMDPTTAEPILAQQVNMAQIGGAALEQGLQLTNANVALQAAQKGVTLAGARQAYTQIAQRLSVDKSISGRFQSAQPVPNSTFGQQQEEQATLLGNADALNRQQSLYAMEQAQFSGHGAASPTSSNVGTNY